MTDKRKGHTIITRWYGPSVVKYNYKDTRKEMKKDAIRQ